MELSQQVVSFELAKRLKELGIKQNSLFCYQPIQNEKPSVWPRNFNLDEFAKPSEDERIAAFTVAELGEMFPPIFQADTPFKKDLEFDSCKDIENRWRVAYFYDFNYPPKIYFIENTEANARAKMLIYLIENGLIEDKQCYIPENAVSLVLGFEKDKLNE